MPKPKRDDEPAKIDREVLRKARIVAAYRGVSVAEYLSERLRPLVEEDHTEEIRKEQATKESSPSQGRKKTGG